MGVVYFCWKDLDLLLSTYASLKGMMDLVYSGIGMHVHLDASKYTPSPSQSDGKANIQCQTANNHQFNIKFSQNKTFLGYF